MYLQLKHTVIAAQEKGNESVLSALKESHYTYRQEEPVHVKASCFWWASNLLRMPAEACGISVGQLAPIVIYHSINTLPDCDFKDGQKESINAEIQHFWKAMAIRQESINSIAKELAGH